MLGLSRRILCMAFRKIWTEREEVWMNLCAGYRDSVSPGRYGAPVNTLMESRGRKEPLFSGATTGTTSPLTSVRLVPFAVPWLPRVVTNGQSQTKLPFPTVVLSCRRDTFQHSLHVCLQVPVQLLTLFQKTLSVTTYLSFKQFNTFFTALRPAIQPLKLALSF